MASNMQVSIQGKCECNHQFGGAQGVTVVCFRSVTTNWNSFGVVEGNPSE